MLKPPFSISDPDAVDRTVSILSFGAHADGTTDDTAYFQSALDYLDDGGTLIVSTGTYKLTSGLTMSSNVNLNLSPGAVMDFSEVAANGIFISVTGSEATGVSLTGNATEGSVALTVTAGDETAFTAGDYVKVGSDAIYDPGRTDTPIGEIGVVSSTSSGTVTLRSPLSGGAYNTADSAFVAKLTMREGNAIRGSGVIKGHGTTVQRGLVADRCVGFRVSAGVQFVNCQQRAMEFYDCIDVLVDGVHVTGSNNSGSGYGVAFFNACQDSTVANSFFRDCRHGTTIGSSVTRKGIGRRLTFANNHISDCALNGAGLDTHAACEHITFIGNTVYDALGDAAINIECPKATIIGNTIIRPSTYGIYMRNETGADTEWLCSGNKIMQPGEMGIRATSGVTVGAGSLIRAIIITGNHVYSAASNGINVSSADTWRLHSVTIANNVVRGSAGVVGILLQKADYCTVTGNIVTLTPIASASYRLNDVTKTTLSGNTSLHVSSATNRGFSLTSVTDLAVTGNVAAQPSGTGSGIVLDAASSHCTVLGNNLRGCATPLNLNSVTSHITTTADASGAYNKVA